MPVIAYSLFRAVATPLFSKQGLEDSIGSRATSIYVAFWEVKYQGRVTCKTSK